MLHESQAKRLGKLESLYMAAAMITLSEVRRICCDCRCSRSEALHDGLLIVI